MVNFAPARPRLPDAPAGQRRGLLPGRTSPAHRGRRIDQTHPNPECAGKGVGAWRDLAHAAVCRNAGILRQPHKDFGVCRSLILESGRDIEHRVLAIVAGEFRDHLTGLHDLAGVRSDGNDDTGRIRKKFCVVKPAPGNAELRGRGTDGGLRGLPDLLGTLQCDAGDDLPLE